MTDFTERHVVVTGGTGALGLAVVEALLQAGAHCHVPCLGTHDPDTAPWRDHDRVTMTPGVDLTDETAVVAYYNDVPDLFASVHLAGGFAMCRIENASAERIMAMLQSNLVSCFLCCREATKRIRSLGDPNGGRIVNVASRPALEPRQGARMTPYAVAKGGIATLTQALGAELAPESILVNAIAPGTLDTPANRKAMPKADTSQWASCDDVARTILFLASAENRVTHGSVVPVYGGGG